MLTRFMQRAYSDMEGDEGVARRIAGEVEEAERNGSNHTLEVRYVRMPDLVVKAIDNTTGEETLIKRSGNCMVMRSDDGALGVMRRHVLAETLPSQFDIMLSAFTRGRLSPDMRDAMFADYGTGKRVSYNLGVEEKRKLKEKKEEKQKQYDKLKDQLTRLRDNPNNQVVTDLGIETDAGMRDKEDELEAKLSLAKAGLDGINAMERNDPHARDKAMQDTFRANDKLDVIDSNKEKLRKEAENRNTLDGGSGMDRYKGYGGKGVGNTKNAMQVRTESYVSDIDADDDRLFASRYVTSRRFQYGTTLSKDSPAVKRGQASQGQNSSQAPQNSSQTPQNSQNSTQNNGKPLDVNEGKPSLQPPPYNPNEREETSNSGNNTNGDTLQNGDREKPQQPQHDYASDIKSVNDKMSGMEKQLGRLTEALKNLQSGQAQTQKPAPSPQDGQQTQQPGAQQEGDASLAPSSSSSAQPSSNPTQGDSQRGRGRQVNWSKFDSDDPVNDPAYYKELNKLTGGYLDKWDEGSGKFNDRGFWQMMQNKYGYQNPDVRERNQQRIEDNANLQAYRAQQMANDGQDFYGELLEGRVNGTSDEIRSGVQDLNRVTYANHARTLGRNLGEDVKYDTDANGNANYYYNQNVDPGRRLPNETDDAMLQRLRTQYGDNVQMTKDANGKPQFSIRRELGNGPSYVSSANPIAAKANSHLLRFGRDMQGMQFKSPQQVAWDLHDKYVKPGVLPAWQRATQAWKNTAANGGGWWERLRNAYQASK